MFVEVGCFLKITKFKQIFLVKFLFNDKGYDGFQSSDTVEMYDPKSDKYEFFLRFNF